MTKIPRQKWLASTLATLLTVPMLIGVATQLAPNAGAEQVATRTLSNGGTGPAYDATNFRGKYFSSGAPTATLTEVCVFGETAGTSALLGFKRTDNGDAPQTVSITLTVNNGWSCTPMSMPWMGPSILVYKVSGTAAIGADSTGPHDSRYSDDNGLSWKTDAARRGYKVTFFLGGVASFELANGGAGPSYDHHLFRGKFFPSDVPVGTVSSVCVFARDAGTTTTVALKPFPDATPPLFTASIAIVAPAAWNCVATSQPWAASSLFVYNLGGNAAIGADNQQPHDSLEGSDTGATWAPESARRGYKVIVSTSG